MLGLVRYEKAIGLSFPAIRNFKIEIWYLPKNYEIKPHSHPNIHLSIFFLFGNNIWFLKRKGERVCAKLNKWWNIFRRFTVDQGNVHWFKNDGRFPLIFLNLERWSSKPTSASQDIKFYGQS
jgi:hypothetical protein